MKLTSNRQLVSFSLFKTFLDLFSKALSFLSIFLFIKNFGTSQYGVFITLTTILAFVTPIATLGLATVLVRFWQEISAEVIVRKEFNYYKRVILISSVVFGATISVTSWMIFHSKQEKILNPTFFSLILFVLCISNCLEFISIEVFRANESFRKYVTFQLTQNLAILLPLIFTSIYRVGLEQLLLIYCFMKVSLLVTLLYFSRVEIDAKSNAGSVISSSRQFKSTRRIRFKYGLSVVKISISQWVVTNCDKLFIAYFASMNLVGVYGLIANLTLIIGALFSGIYLLIFPDVIKLQDSSLEIFKKYFKEKQEVVTSLILSFFPVILLWSSSITTALRVTPEQHLCLILLISGPVLHQWNGLFHYNILAGNESHRYARVWVSAAALSLVLNLWLIPNYGITGAAATSLVTNLFIEGTVFYLNFRSLGIQYVRLMIPSASTSGITFISLVLAGSASLHFSGDFFGSVWGAGCYLLTFATLNILFRVWRKNVRT